MCAAHRWEVPERYNIATDVCDKHPRDKPAMVWESFDGSVRELDWGELQDLANQAAHTLAARGRDARRPRRCRPAADPRDGRDLLRRLEARRDPALDVGALRRRRHRASAVRLAGTAPRHRRRERAALRPAVGAGRARARRARRWPQRRPTSSAPTRQPTIRRSSTTRRARPGSRRASCTRTATSSRHEEFTYCHEVRTASASTGWASGPGPPASRRCSARGGSARCSACTGVRPASTRTGSSTSSAANAVTNVFTTPTAMRSMMAIDDAGTRYPQVFRRVCSAGEPLNPEAIRWFRQQYGVTVLDYYGLTESYPLVANYPGLEVREGSMGKPMPGWDVQILDEDEQPVPAGRTRRDLPPRALESALSARLLAQRRGRCGDVRRRVVPHEGRRRRGRGRLLLVRRSCRRRDHRCRLPDRPVRGRVGLPRASGSARSRRRGALPTSYGATSSRRSSSSPTATRRPTSSRARSSSSCASGSRRTPTRA